MKLFMYPDIVALQYNYTIYYDVATKARKDLLVENLLTEPTQNLTTDWLTDWP